MSHKAPSAGTKVTTNAPIKQEHPGPVNPDSLAAESQAFRQANSLDHDNQQSRPQEGSAHAPGTSTSHSHGTSMPRETGGHTADTAPSYVNNQYYRYPGGPHGKNIKEDDSIGTGDAKNASFSADIGSKDDPSLLGEQKFSSQNTTPPGASGSREKMGVDKTTYDALDPDQQA
jgi:hypothetical protein